LLCLGARRMQGAEELCHCSVSRSCGWYTNVHVGQGNSQCLSVLRVVSRRSWTAVVETNERPAPSGKVSSRHGGENMATYRCAQRLRGVTAVSVHVEAATWRTCSSFARTGRRLMPEPVVQATTGRERRLASPYREFLPVLCERDRTFQAADDVGPPPTRIGGLAQGPLSYQQLGNWVS
jgi:hypothetical protein